MIMALKADTGTILGIIALVLMLPVAYIANMTTPMVADWISRRSKVSLGKRIAKIEKKLAELNKYPVTSDVESTILWSIKRAENGILLAANGLIIVIYFGVKSVADVNSASFRDFTGLAFFIWLFNIFTILRDRYAKDFRWERSAQVRENLTKSLEDLKQLYASWP